MKARSHPEDDDRQIGAFEAKTHLARLLDEVAAGESVTITKRGKPVARLVPVADADAQRRAKIRAAIAALREVRAANHLDGITIRELIDEGRRY